MNNEKVRRCHGERGASLILAIVFMVVVGGISAAVLATTTSGLQDRVALDQARNREYAADAAIETSIARVRGLATPGVTATGCPDVYSPALNGVAQIRVECANVPTPASTVTQGPALDLQNDVIFSACITAGACSGANTIIRAEVNYQAGSPVKTYVLSWSVNG